MKILGLDDSFGKSNERKTGKRTGASQVLFAFLALLLGYSKDRQVHAGEMIDLILEYKLLR